ncbi:hypothetical protein ABFT23_01250 [Nocardioides sp. C4-1]|uniref:hypothetical protein n=1 Tax=Nocardioides sp. C4-1 TaxID=3151851 RepID=UPI0032655430
MARSVRLVGLLIVSLAVVIGGTVQVPAQAAYQGGYNREAAAVASKIRCKNPRLHDRGGATKSSLVCNLRGKRVNVITFRNERQQTDWLDVVDLAFPDGGYVGVGRGVVVVAYNGNRAAASAGARAINGAVVPVGL